MAKIRHGRIRRHHHHHHHYGRRRRHHIMINPYAGNPNIVTITWNNTINGYDENDPGFMKMQAEGYDPTPAKRVIAEIHALKDQFKFKNTPDVPHPCILIICFLLIIPWFFVICYLIAKQIAFADEVNDFRTHSQGIVNKHNQALTQQNRYYFEVGQFYPTWLYIHLIRAPQPGMMVMMNPNMMGQPQMMNQGVMMNQGMMMNQGVMMNNQVSMM